ITLRIILGWFVAVLIAPLTICIRFTFKELYAICDYLCDEYFLPLAIFVCSSLQSPIYSNLTAFFHVLGQVLSLLTPRCAIYKICFVFTLCIFKWTIDCYREISYRFACLCVSEVNISCETTNSDESIHFDSSIFSFIVRFNSAIL